MKMKKILKIGVLSLSAIALLSSAILQKEFSFLAEENNLTEEGFPMYEEDFQYISYKEDGSFEILELDDVEQTPSGGARSYGDSDVYELIQLSENEAENKVVATFDSLEEAEQVRLEKETDEERYAVYNSGQLKSITNGVVNFRTKSVKENTSFTNVETGKGGYTNGSYAPDAAYIRTEGNKVIFKLAGVIGSVNANEVEILDYDNENQVKSVSHYQVSDGNLYHKLTTNIKESSYSSSILVGKKQNYMEDNGIYYSYDGHYFYTSYVKMIKDYQNGTYANAINSDNAYYSYYQFLTHRSKTNITAEQINQYIKEGTGGKKSVMLGLGESFIKYQNEYGSNALLMLGVAINESAWGTSSIALNKNNLFGHGAVDSNPYWGANGYANASDSVLYHAKVFVSEGYLDPKDYEGRYNGGHLGDKASGMAVKYASDPYWGEKAAQTGYRIDSRFKGNNKESIDFGNYTFGMKAVGTNLNVRKEPNTSSTVLYNTTSAGTFPFIILEEVEGESVNGNTKWYKIQTDPTLNANRTEIVQDKGEYNFANNYGYVSASLVSKIVYQKNGGSESEDLIEYLLGDINGNGVVADAADCLMAKNYVFGILNLNEKQLKAGDINKNGNIDAADALRIKDKFFGISTW